MSLQTEPYLLSSILPFVRQSLRGKNAITYDEFVWGLWTELEKVGVPGISKNQRAHITDPYEYTNAPDGLRSVTAEAFFYLFHNGIIMPAPPVDTPRNPLQHAGSYHLTPRGRAWSANVDPLPEDANGYMQVLRKLVPKLDSVIEQYICEGLSSFEKQTYFAAAVMVGAAAEKAVYLLAESMVDAFRNVAPKEKLKKLIESRKLGKLFDAVEKTINDAHAAKVLPYDIFDGAVSHLMSLIQAIKMQRNDAVHPMNARVSADSVRLSFHAFPHALEKIETLRVWFLSHANSI